jgi:putative ABC transport system permease protein
MPLLLRFALALCPPEFRREYGEQIAADVRQRRLSLFAAAWDVVLQGIVLRLDALRGYVTYAVRSLRRAPLFALMVVVTIAIAIAANVAVVSTLEGVLFKPLPYPHAERIVAVANATHDEDFSYLMGKDTAAMTASFEQFGLRAADSEMLTLPSGSINLQGSGVDPGYFQVLGMKPELGRIFELRDSRSRVAIVSDRVWRRYFGAGPAIIGRSVLFDGQPYVVAGVAPPSFRDLDVGGLSDGDYWLCIPLNSEIARNRGWSQFRAWALLKPGVAVTSAQADVARVTETLRERYPHNYVQWKSASVTSARTAVVGDVASMLYATYAAVFVLLIIACANVTNMMLARVAARERELTLRAALGATRLDLAAQLGTEVALLFGTGAGAGILLGAAVLQIFTPYVREILPRWDTVHVDIFAVAYVAAALLLALLVATVTPLLLLSTDLAPALKGSQTTSSGGRAVSYRSFLVSIEVALALTVVLSAALIVRSFISLANAPLGFSAEHVYLVEAPTLLPTRYKSPESIELAYRTLQSTMDSVPGVQSTSCALARPFGNNTSTVFNFVAQTQQHAVAFNIVCDRYFTLLHVPLLTGRDFGTQETMHSPRVVLVNRTFAVQYYGSPGRAIGQRIVPSVSYGKDHRPPRTIIGVVDDTRNSLAEPPIPTVFLPQAQFGYTGVNRYLIKTRGADAGLAAAFTDVYRSADPFFAPPSVVPLSRSIDASAANARLASSLFISFSIIALILALAGIYSVTAYSVAQRLREFGIRKAVGASATAVLGLVVRRALRQAVIGIVLGLVLAAFVVRFLATILYETSPFDAVAITTAVAILFVCTLLAAALPALSAMRIEPAVALRYE